MIASTPFLAVIYSPADFGAYAGFVALSAIIGSFSTLRLDVLVPLVDKTKTMSAFLQICVFGPFVFCAVIFPFLLFTAPETFDFLSVEITHVQSILMLLLSLGVSGALTMRALATRLLEFGLIGKLQIARVFYVLTFSFVIGLSFPELRSCGLILGQIFGDFLYSVTMFFCVVSQNVRKRIFKCNLQRLAEAIKTEKRAVQTLMTTQFLATIYERLPSITLLLAFGPIEAGFYELASRFSRAPAAIFSSAFDDIFKQKAVALWRRSKRFDDLIRFGFMMTANFSLVLFLIAWFLMPIFVEVILTRNWHNVWPTMSLLLVVSVFSFNSKCFDKVPLILGAHHFIFYWHFSRFLIEVGSSFLALVGVLTYVEWLFVIAATRSALYSWKLAGSYRLSKSTRLL